MKPLHQRAMLYSVLAAGLAFAFWVSGADGSQADDVVAPVAVRPKPVQAIEAPAATEGPARLPLEKMDRTFVAANDSNPFGVKSWMPAPAVAAAAIPVAAPTPVAPPLPYTFAGKLEIEAGASLVYLVKGEQSFAVSKGETFDDNYRLDGIENGNLVIVYLPLGTKQLLPIGTEISE
jgi:hypothetical protein